MSAAETIAQAIEKLEGLRAASTQPGLAWRTEPTTELEKGCRCLSCWETVPGFLDITSDGDAPRGRDDVYPSLAAGDADLIVTLHRTIDAQLAILRRTYSQEEFYTDWEFVGAFEAEIKLAEAILGDNS